MCNVAVIEFFIEHVRPSEFHGKRVLEVGSKYVNGSIRPLVERFFKPKEYLGIDIEPGKFVDMVLPAEEIVKYFGEESFDIIISTELLEHVSSWRVVINNIKAALKRGGYVYITTRSYGFPRHGYPYDFWRYETDDIIKVFSDFDIIALTKDHEAPGAFLKARKPLAYTPTDLSNIAIYSIVLGKRTFDIPSMRDMPFAKRLMLKVSSSKASQLLQEALRTSQHYWKY